MYIREGHILPTVRIQKIVLENFKSVAYGEVIFKCGRKVIQQDTESDILGIYGQNGSGKTTVIEALSVLKSAMSGRPIDARFSDCIRAGAEYSQLSFTFDLQYPTNKNRTVVYSFKLGALPNEDYSDYNNITDTESKVSVSTLYENKIRIFDEVIRASGDFDGEKQKMQDVLTTSVNNYPIGPSRKVTSYVGQNRDGALIELEVSKRTASNTSRSFIFSKETLSLFNSASNYTEYFQILLELNHYAQYYLYTVDTRLTGLVGTTLLLPLFTRSGVLPIPLLGSRVKYPKELFEIFEESIEGINKVLPTVVAGLKLEIAADEIVSKDKTEYEIKLFSVRKDCRVPLRSESAGIIRIISILSLVICAYNDKSITVAVDELDAGVYEYLLGEILIGLETYGKGQFVFTSHNLRPLEVLKKESILFTTSNPDNRYIRLKGVGHSNNLRNLYLREILDDSQDEQIYDAAKRQRMNAAFLKAGGVYGEEE